MAADDKSVEAAAHGAYLKAINSNDVDALLADLTDDIVYESPGEPELVGKAAVRKWVADYFAASHALGQDLHRLRRQPRLGIRVLHL